MTDADHARLLAAVEFARAAFERALSDAHRAGLDLALEVHEGEFVDARAWEHATAAEARLPGAPPFVRVYERERVAEGG